MNVLWALEATKLCTKKNGLNSLPGMILCDPGEFGFSSREWEFNPSDPDSSQQFSDRLKLSLRRGRQITTWKSFSKFVWSL